VGEAFFVIDPDTRQAQYVNPAYERIFGHLRAHAAATPEAWADHIYPEDRANVMAVQEEGLRTGDFNAMVFRLQKDAGVIRWIRCRMTPVRDGMGRIVRVVGIAEDITELKRTEEQFFEAQKMEAVGRLAGGVAHDFNNVLTAILGYVDLLDGSLVAGDDRHGDVGEIRSAAQRAAGLTRQLLTFSRHQVVERVVLSPNEVIANLDRMLRRMIGEDVKLTLELGENAGNIRGDTVQLEQVIMNLVVNARDAMPAGGTVTITSANVDLMHPIAESHQPVTSGRYVLISITDTGEGMSEDTMLRIFEPFFTTKDKGRGTGLGLSTVYGIVRQSDGFIGASSTPGAGTTFRVYLPRVDVAVEPESPTAQAPQVVSGTETILLAEDDPQLRRLCASLLGRMGYRVLEAASAEDALLLAQRTEQRIDLVLTDVVMPGSSGPVLIRQLLEERPHVRVLYMSGYTGDAIVRLGMLRPGLHYLQKPFAPMELAQRVRLVLDAAE
jgi:PAS domain S-box-containing protein